jgi:Fe-Mn family superoxide dismutase
MSFKLPPLPYDRSALAPHISAETLDYHHGKHHKAYIDKVNGWEAERGLAGKSLVEVIREASAKGDKPLFNNAGQIWNHSFFWQCLAPPGQKPSAKLADLIGSSFGSTEAMLKKFATEADGHFASGWTWLMLQDSALRIVSLHDADCPVANDGMKPLFTIDVWEHAYYIDYRNARPKFVDAVLGNLINWDFVAQNLDGGGIARADQPAEKVAV